MLISGDTQGHLAGRPGAVWGGAVKTLFLAFAVLLGVRPERGYAFRGNDADVLRKNQSARVAKTSARVATRPARQEQAVQAADKLAVEVVWDGDNQAVPVVVRGSDLGRRQAFSGGKGLRVKGKGSFKEDAVAVLDDLSGLFRISDASNEFVVRKVDSDKLGKQHVRLSQTYRGLRVVGGELVVHFEGAGSVYEVSGQYTPEIGLSVVPALKAAQALRIAQDDLVGMGNPEGKAKNDPELVVFAIDSSPCLAYELLLTYREPGKGIGRWRYWVDAQQGAILLRYNDVKRVDPPTADGSITTISGNRLAGEGGAVTEVEGWLENTGLYYLYNPNQLWCLSNAAPEYYSYFYDYPDVGGYAFRDTADWGESDPAEISAANNISLIQRYYQQVHGRNSYDGAGAVANVYVHQPDEDGYPMVNAYWFEDSISIGDGDGYEADNLGVLDVVAHEYTHAVTEHTCDLIYANDSGALNESFSDIFGACAEFYAQQDDRASYPAVHAGQADWLLGEDCWLSSMALRDMRNPANSATVGAGNEQPTRYQGTYWYSGLGDNGGVHQNSGVQNFFFYLLSEGGSGTNDHSAFGYDVKGISLTNAEQVAYRALTVYCTANTSYPTVRSAWISAALDLDPTWVRPVKSAWNAVFGLAPPLPMSVLSASELPVGWVGSWYQESLRAGYGISPYVWQLQPGDSLPAGLALGTDGVLSGLMVPESEGTSTFRAIVTDLAGETVTNTFSLRIRPPFTVPYQETFENGGADPDGWEQTDLSQSQAWVFGSGSPYDRPAGAYAGSYCASFYVNEDAQTGSVTRLESPMLDFGTNVQAARLTFWHYMAPWEGSQDTLKVFYKTSYYGEWIQLASFSAATQVWTKRTLDLPDPNRTYYIAFEGTANYGYGIHIDEVEVFDPTPVYKITNETQLPDAYIERAYSYSFTAQGGAGGYQFDLAAGALPTGLVLTVDGQITGVVATVQSSEFTVRVTDALAAQTSAVFRLDVTLPLADIFYEDFEHRGSLPAGWTNEYVVRTVAWRCQTGGGDGDDLHNYHTPATAHGGIYNAALFFSTSDVFQLDDDHQTRLVTPAIDLSRAETPRLIFWHYMAELEGGQDQLRVYYKNSATASWGLLATYTTSVTAWTQRTLVLPDPTETYYLAFEGNARFGNGVCIDDVRVTDESSAPAIITSSTLPLGQVGVAYTQALVASGGVEPYTWGVVSNALPSGLGLRPDGVITGMPQLAQTATFRVRVVGGDAYASTNLFTLRINPLPSSPYAEGFETGGAIPEGWSSEAVYGSLGWTYRNGSPDGTPSAAHSGSYNACFYSDVASRYRTKLVSPMLNLGVGVTNVMLTFWHCMATYPGQDNDQLVVYYKTNAVSGWMRLTNYVQAVSVWTQQSVWLPHPSPTTYIAFEGYAYGGQGVCIDDVNVTGDIFTYASWKGANFSTGELADEGVSGDRADPDGDGVPNALEYAMGLDPWVPDTEGLPFGGVVDGYLMLTFRMGKEAFQAGTLYEVEACTNLLVQGWTTDDVFEVLPRADSNTWWQAVFYHDVPVTHTPSRFLRLKVTPQ